jgi:hypothetical protein
MSHKTRGRIRTLFAVPSAAVLVLSASQLLASPPAPSRGAQLRWLLRGELGVLPGESEQLHLPVLRVLS